jgi:hypothetical protein
MTFEPKHSLWLIFRNYSLTLKDWIEPERITNEEKEAWKKWNFDKEPFSTFYDPVRKVTRSVPESQKTGGQSGGLFYVIRLHDKEKECLQNEIGHVVRKFLFNDLYILNIFKNLV